jgi:chemotaxis response regulator CheB
MSPFPQEKPSTSNSQQLRVVAIGASAGGLEAVTALLRALPVNIGMAFVLIQHLDPKRRSMLAGAAFEDNPNPCSGSAIPMG